MRQHTPISFILSATATSLRLPRTALRIHTSPPPVVAVIGAPGAVSAQGTLAFCRSDGAAELIPADKLAVLLAGCKTLRLVLLNACQARSPAQFGLCRRSPTVDPPGRRGGDRHAGADLRRHALRFSQEFYRALADGLSVEQAVGEGRRRINEVAWTWGIPAVYFQGMEPFVVAPLNDTEKAERLWQKVQSDVDPDRRSQILAQVLKLQPGHAGAQAAQRQLDNAAEAAGFTLRGRHPIRTSSGVKPIARWTMWSDWRLTSATPRSLLAEVLGNLSGVPPTAPSDNDVRRDEYRPILNALQEGRLVPFLGWEVSHFGRPLQDGWVPGHSLPDETEAARELAQRLEGVTEGVASLPQASQYTTLLEGERRSIVNLATYTGGIISPPCCTDYWQSCRAGCAPRAIRSTPSAAT